MIEPCCILEDAFRIFAIIITNLHLESIVAEDYVVLGSLVVPLERKSVDPLQGLIIPGFISVTDIIGVHL
jgi:hypothetical protein